MSRLFVSDLRTIAILRERFENYRDTRYLSRYFFPPPRGNFELAIRKNIEVLKEKEKEKE